MFVHNFIVHMILIRDVTYVTNTYLTLAPRVVSLLLRLDHNLCLQVYPQTFIGKRDFAD